jgi:hypothetical protein
MVPIASLFTPRDIVMYGILAALVAGALVALRANGRRHHRFLVVGATTFAGWVAWNFTLNATNARGFNVDAPVIYLSWADAGSGVFAFVVTALVLGLVTERDALARTVVGAAAIAGIAAAFVDLFVL